MNNKIIIILAFALAVFTSCDFRLKANEDENDPSTMKVERYDRLESRYVITGDFSALQQMNTEYPIETRTLVEKMLQIGDVSNHDISERFLRFFQDSTLQTLVNDVESEYADMSDINSQLRKSFSALSEMIPDFPLPRVYSQIGALDQSIVVGDKTVGISLDKYMGQRYHLYKQFKYSNEQLEQMTRSHIVPDCIVFYLISLYPMDNFDSQSQLDKDLHMGKIMWVTNKALGREFFTSQYVKKIARYMAANSDVTITELLSKDDYSRIK